jgi:uncharacterized protein with HEPN domain
MTRTEQDRLRDIRDAVEAIEGHIAGAGELDPDDVDPTLSDALLYQFVVLGEAVKHLSPETRESESDVPWQNVAGLRDMIAHEYFHIELERILDIVKRDLPTLKTAVERLLATPEP